MSVVVHGMGPLEGETAFAFLVVRLRETIDRDGLVRVLRYLAPLVPDAEGFIAELPDPLDEPMRLVGMPWLPPEAGHATGAQRRLVDQADAVGIEEAWFFQTGTSLYDDAADVDAAGDDAAAEDDDDEDSIARPARAMTVPGRATSVTDEITKTTQLPWADDGGDDVVSGEIGDDAAEDDELDDDLEDVASAAAAGGNDATWTQGPPPQVSSTRFPVDGYPAILDELDWEDFGIAFKLAGPYTPGEGTVLLGFHTLWLAPYAGRYRNAAVTIDRTRHAAHLWVDRFSVPCSPEEQVHHLLWVVSKLDEVVPVVHARFGGATMVQKLGDEEEPFVLGGNPLLRVFAGGGERAVDAWLAAQTDWSPREVGAMLRELAIEIASPQGDEDDDEDNDEDDDEDNDEDNDEDDGEDDGDADHDEERGRADADDASDDEVALDEDEDEGDDDDADDDGGDEGGEDDEDDDDDADDDEAEGNEDEDRGRQIAIYAGELLRARAAAGRLDPRAAERLLPVLEQPEKFEHRRRAVVEILGALRHRPAVPALIKILDETTIKSSLDSIGKEQFIAATAAALGAIGDPAAIPALARVVAAPGPHNDKARPVAADALAACLAASPEPRALDEGVLGELLTTIRERNDGELNAESHFAYGRVARQLPPERRAEARRRLTATDSARDDATAQLARHAALVLASPTADVDAPPRDLAPLLHEALTSLDYDHDYTVRNLRVALRVAEVVPELVDPDDLVWLTRFTEGDIRARAHALLDLRGKPMPAAPTFDRAAARALSDDELADRIRDPHVVGRATLVAEAGRRRLRDAYPAIVDACHDVISRARQGGANLLDPDTRTLETALPILRENIDEDVIALFDRMLRHSNFHVKWELLQAPPDDERLIGGMFHVLGERWGWQEKTAKEWLAHYQGTATYELERRRAGSPDLDDVEDEEEAREEPSDEDIN